jgi:hypothetical protein
MVIVLAGFGIIDVSAANAPGSVEGRLLEDEKNTIDIVDREIERTNAEPIAIEELFGPMGETSFESEEDLKTMLLGKMPQDTGGRANYSDRGGSLPTETEEAEEASEQTSADLEGEATDPDAPDQ